MAQATQTSASQATARVKFGAREVGDGAPVFITYEAGPTHTGLESAKRLVTLAAEAKADAVKFQIVDPDRLVADRSMLFTYDVLVDRATGKTETVSEPLYDILCRRYLNRDEWKELKRHSDAQGLAFFATALFEDEVDLVQSIGCASIKIASADINHWPLLRHAARTGLSIQLDTGSASIGEIETAIDVIRREGNEGIIIHHCPTGYPARLDSIDLNVIPTLKRMFPYPVAFSDHNPGTEMDIAAVAVGANLVEKTITEDRTIRGCEHIMSLDPADMKAFVQTIRDIERALGQKRRVLAPAELERRQRVRRSAYAKTAARAGQKLSDMSVEFRRPGTGIGPDIFELLKDRTLKRDLPAGQRIEMADLA